MRTAGTYNDRLALAASTWCQRSCMRSGVLHVACGNRREAVCPACSAVYKRDARQLVRAGLAGSKGIPETITAHPRVFATLTAPSFGPVHSRRLRGKTVLPCVPVATPMRAAARRAVQLAARHVQARPGEDLWPAGPAICWEITAMPAIPQVTPRTVHKICEETRAPVAVSAAQSRPDCCTAVIYLHTAIHRLCLTSPDVTQISAVTVVRAPTHCCSTGAHRQVAARIPAAARAKQRTAVPCSVLRTVGQHAAGLPAVVQWILRYCRAYGRGSSVFGLEHGPARGRPDMLQ
jgi:replication initiator protein RepSA